MRHLFWASSAEISKGVWAAGCLYWASLLIQVSHLGETIIQDSPCVIVEPTIRVLARPCPDDDSTPVIRESLLDGFNQAIERLRKHLEHSVIADAFPAGEGRVPTNLVITAGLLALNKAGKRARALQNGWSQNSSGRPTSEYELTQAKRVFVYPNLDDSGTGQVVNHRKAMAVHRRASPGDSRRCDSSPGPDVRAFCRR